MATDPTPENSSDDGRRRRRTRARRDQPRPSRFVADDDLFITYDPTRDTTETSGDGGGGDD